MKTKKINLSLSFSKKIYTNLFLSSQNRKFIKKLFQDEIFSGASQASRRRFFAKRVRWENFKI
jgi:hypothetical protein